MAKRRLPNGGPTLGQDIVWETRVRYKTPPCCWFALWTAGRKWKWDGQAQGAEVASPSKDTVDYSGWGTAMEKLGIKNYDAAQYHVWTWLYKKNGTFARDVDGAKVQSGSNYHWGYGNKAGDEPIDMDFLFEGGWGHNQIGSVNKELPASAPDGKFYEWNYSRIYLSRGSEAAHGGARTPAALRRAGGPSAVFVKTDRTIQGSWKGVYGAASRTDWAVTWAGSTLDVRASQKAGGSTDRVTGQWGTNDPTYDIGCNLTDAATHQVSLYGLD